METRVPLQFGILNRLSMRELYTFYFDAFWIAVKSILEHKLRIF